jgi:hypothetical protein
VELKMASFVEETQPTGHPPRCSETEAAAVTQKVNVVLKTSKEVSHNIYI